MIEINLLPPQMRVRKREPMKLPALPVIPAAIGVISLLIAVQVLLWAAVQIKAASRDSLKKKISALAASNKEAMAVDAKLREISSRVDMIDKLSAARFNVARKLNDLSDAMVSGVWLRSIDVKKGESAAEPGTLRQLFVIEGSNVAAGESGEAAVGKFVNSLKENESFCSDFDDIELAKVERRKVQNTEVIDFVVICHFKKGKGL